MRKRNLSSCTRFFLIHNLYNKNQNHKICLMTYNLQLFSLQLFQIRDMGWFLLILTEGFGIVED